MVNLLVLMKMRVAQQKHTFFVVSKALDFRRRPGLISWPVWTMVMGMQVREPASVHHHSIWTQMPSRLVLQDPRAKNSCRRPIPTTLNIRTKLVDSQPCSSMTRSLGVEIGRLWSKQSAMLASSVHAICLHLHPLRLIHLQFLCQCQYPHPHHLLRHPFPLQHQVQRVTALLQVLKQSVARSVCMGNRASGAKVGPCAGTQKMIAQQDRLQSKSPE